MRLTEVLGARVVDRDGTELGPVRDVRLVQRGPLVGTFGSALVVDELIVGGRPMAQRLGYDCGQVGGPWLIGLVARRLSRRAIVVPWDQVASVEARSIRLRCDRGDLASPSSATRDDR